MMRKAEKEIKKICWEISEVKWIVPFFIFISLNFSYNRFYFTINFIYIWLVKGSHKVLDQSQYEVKQNLLKLFNTDYKIALHAC